MLSGCSFDISYSLLLSCYSLPEELISSSCSRVLWLIVCWTSSPDSMSYSITLDVDGAGFCTLAFLDVYLVTRLPLFVTEIFRGFILFDLWMEFLFELKWDAPRAGLWLSLGFLSSVAIDLLFVMLMFSPEFVLFCWLLEASLGF